MKEEFESIKNNKEADIYSRKGIVEYKYKKTFNGEEKKCICVPGSGILDLESLNPHSILDKLANEYKDKNFTGDYEIITIGGNQNLLFFYK
jgi:hypothetical protein